MKNKFFTLIVLLLGALPLLAQEAAATAEAPAAAAGSGSVLDWTINNLVLVIGSLVILGALLALYNVTNMLMQVQKLRLLQEHGVAVLEKVAPQAVQPLWQRLYKRWTNVVPVEREEDILIKHPHDGIYELDNSLPPWWLAMFYVTIVFGVAYFAYYHVLDYGMTQDEEYAAEVKAAEEDVKAYLATQSDMVDETTVTLLTEAPELALGQTIYSTNCAACHGQAGEGGVGPNLTDEFWLHGGNVAAIFKTIKYGVPEKGMISWQQQLRPADIQRVSSYILSLQGTNPPNGKEPQGERFQVDAETPAAADSTVAAGTMGMIEQ